MIEVVSYLAAQLAELMARVRGAPLADKVSFTEIIIATTSKGKHPSCSSCLAI